MGSVTTALEQLKASLSETAVIVTPVSDQYEESIKRWASSAERKAGIVVFPTSADDVSKAVLYSKANKLELAVCGGGHATSGSSSKAATAQGGCLWEDVDVALAKHGLATVGGTVNHTGIGGLTLGGGYGYLSGEYGLVVDNLLAVELVLADGSIVTASENENKDLFWAARGAGVGFGVATSFTYRAYDQKNTVWGGMLIFPKPQLDKCVEFANWTMEVQSGKHTLILGFGAPPPAFQPVILAVVYYNGTESEAKEFYKPLLDLRPLADMTSVMPYEKVNTMLNDGLAAGFRRTMKGSAFMAPLSTTFAQSLFDDYEKFLKDVPDAALSVILLEYVSYHKILEVPQEAMAFANRGAYGNLLFGPGWTNPENDKACREWTRVMAAKSGAELKRIRDLGTDIVTKSGVGEYVNYDSLGVSADILFGVNTPRLRELKKRYDPMNVFCKGPNLLA